MSLPPISPVEKGRPKGFRECRGKFTFGQWSVVLYHICVRMYKTKIQQLTGVSMSVNIAETHFLCCIRVEAGQEKTQCFVKMREKRLVSKSVKDWVS